MLSKAALFIALSLAASPLPVHAKCRCECVDGKVTTLCERSNEIAPRCPSRICRTSPPAVRPIKPPRIPPLGVEECRRERVYDPTVRRYEWKEVCRAAAPARP